jgi:hypothetical protein
MTDQAMFPPLVYTIWWIGLIVTLVVFVPLSVVLLHRLWRAAHSIRVYAQESLTAAGGIAGNTGYIGALDDTIAVASQILSTATAIEQKLGAATGILAKRAEGR